MRMSIGQALGITTAGDRLRAAERAARREGLRRGKKLGLEQERKKNVAENAARDRKIAKFLRLNGVSAKLLIAARAIK